MYEVCLFVKTLTAAKFVSLNTISFLSLSKRQHFGNSQWSCLHEILLSANNVLESVKIRQAHRNVCQATKLEHMVWHHAYDYLGSTELISFKIDIFILSIMRAIWPRLIILSLTLWLCSKPVIRHEPQGELFSWFPWRRIIPFWTLF